jgi:hypothetical protein
VVWSRPWLRSLKLSQAQRVPEVQAVIARCRQSSAAAAAKAIDTFLDECSEIGAHATLLTKAAIVAATATSVAELWMNWRAPQLPSPLRQPSCSRTTGPTRQLPPLTSP